MAKILDHVKVKWQNGFVIVRLESVELVENWNFRDLTKSGGVSLTHVYFYKFVALLLFTEVAADWFRSVSVEDLEVLGGVVRQVAFEKKF